MIPLEHSSLKLDSSGVTGFFGGEKMIVATKSMYFEKGRRWLGWYNSPGSFTVAQKFGQFARGRLWNGLFPGFEKPETFFDLAGKGPKFTGVCSGITIPDTGHIGLLLSQVCGMLPSKRMFPSKSELPSEHVEGRVSITTPVTVAWLTADPVHIKHKSLRRPYILASLPILASAGTMITCMVFGDWFCASMILLGICSNGIFCFVVGSGKLMFDHPTSPPGSPRGDGILYAEGGMVILVGTQQAVNAVTRGRFSLRYSGEPNFQTMGLCALLLAIQFLLQLLIIPQGTIFGQIMFLSSFVVSWSYNTYLSSLDREKMQRNLLVDMLGTPALRTYVLGTRTAMTVFVLLTLRPPNSRKLLDELIPNDGVMWNIWKDAVLDMVQSGQPMTFEDRDFDGVVEDHYKVFLRTIYGDAEDAFNFHRINVGIRYPEEGRDMKVV